MTADSVPENMHRYLCLSAGNACRRQAEVMFSSLAPTGCCPAGYRKFPQNRWMRLQASSSSAFEVA
jgi:hypothetical protein